MYIYSYFKTYYNIYLLKKSLSKHPLIYELIDSLRKEHQLYVNKLIKIKTGYTYARKPALQNLQDRILNMIDEYSFEKGVDFLMNLSLILKLD